MYLKKVVAFRPDNCMMPATEQMCIFRNINERRTASSLPGFPAFGILFDT